MPRLHVDLQDGFSGDRVIVRVGGREAFRSEHLTTRMMLGFAESFEVDVPEDRVTVSVEVPSRDVSASQELHAAETPYVGVSLLDGMISVRASRTPFAYL